MNNQHAGQAIVDSLALHGVERVFVVPGESYLAVLDGLYESPIEAVVCRHEGGAAYMAEAHGKFAGKPGVAMVTRGPGAANAFVALHTAWQDAVPLVLFVGLVPVADRMRESFQEFDPYAWFGTQCKRVMVLDEAERASEVVAEAFFAAGSGRPGPVVVGLPEDVITRTVSSALYPPLPVSEGALSPEDLEAVRAVLGEARRPLLFVGGQRWTPEAVTGLTRFAEQNGIPVVQDWRAADRVPFDSPVNCGPLGYGRTDASLAMFEEADVLLAVGALPTDVTTDGFTARQGHDRINILVNIDTGLRGRSGAVTRHLIASPVAFAEAVADLQLGREQSWDVWRAGGRAAQQALSTVPAPEALPPTCPGTVHMGAVMGELVKRLPDDAVFTFGAGNHCVWAQRYLPTRTFPSQLSTRNGSMGYSVPAAVAASLANPERLCVVVSGDGDFLMNGQEIATAVQYGAAMLILVMDNGRYGTICLHQEAQFPGRASGTRLANPDFAALCRAYGGHGETLVANEEAAGAIERALRAVTERRLPALIHAVTDPRHDLP
ncbi:thiamine pyrophosphate-dependent enzyme [Halomonas kalidii]|uniref:Thiamine pyrophosphate-binding protein n=1 Tax=Halomonas kalidii TaxID=3043293 RepID=A0ABT6VR06_9GAMM|nr:thiamine pyrophosphate-dependent enzyme [Halomonas kalidii]MDI5936421.1 thiamine pyrophosphate-binding protein [Halomonas kalidii]